MRKNIFLLVLKKIIGKQISDIIVGGLSGSTFFLVFGIREFMISVVSSWRLVKEESIITGWRDSEDIPDGPLTLGIRGLANDIVKSVSLNKFYDLNILFESGKELQIFVDITPNMPLDVFLDFNWDFTNFKNNECYSIMKDQTIKVEPFNPELNIEKEK